MTPFEEADQRLAQMHGYEPLALARLEAKLDAQAAQLDRLETLARELRHALNAGAVGAVGRWQ